MDNLDAEMNVIADMLLTGHGIDYMAIRDPERLKEILTERGVDLGNQAFVNESGEYCIVDNLDDIWSMDTQDGVSFGTGQGKPSNNAENLLSDEQIKDVGFKRIFIRETVSGKLAEYDEKLADNGVYEIISDDMNPSHEIAGSYIADNLDGFEQSLQHYIDFELKDYPEEYRQQFLNEEIDNLQSSMRFYYDIAEDYKRAQQDAWASSDVGRDIMDSAEALLSELGQIEYAEPQSPTQPVQGASNLDKFNM
jgi:hypothetical protein